MKADVSVISVYSKLTVRAGGEGFFGPGVAELLEGIEDSGSLKEACRAMGLSYSKGRMIVKRAERCLGYPLVGIRHGGTGGGAAALTEEGHGFLRAYRELERDVQDYAGRKAGALLAGMESWGKV